MPYCIGLAGKGGTGKTTIAGLLIKYLVEQGKTPILGVDADSNANLNEVLGLKVEETLGEAREEMKRGVATGMTKNIFMQMKLEEAVVESKNIGRRLLILNQAKEEDRATLKKFVGQYPFELVGILPEDSLVREFDLQGRPTIQLDQQSPAVRAAYRIFKDVLNGEKQYQGGVF
jgi:CO dehydrogenase nickel-insertion accessory protein CooC1